MAVFNYIDWVARKPITASDLSQMSENDQYLKDYTLSLPQGILGWTEKDTDRAMGSATVGTWYTMADFSVTVDVPEDRMIKAIYVCKSVNGGSSAGVKGLGARIRHTNPDTTFGRIDVTVEQMYRRACPPVIHVGTLTAGTHTFTVEHVVYSAVNTGGILFEATTAGPHQLFIEDIGAFVDES
jgi:hypothetical protein